MTDGLKDAHREAIIAVIAANDRVERAVLFGSRATGTNTVTSDVDIALFGDRLTLTDQARLAAAVDEIPMAQSVDLILYDSVPNRTLREHIRNDGVEWYRRLNTSEAKPHLEDEENGTTITMERVHNRQWSTVQLGEVVDLLTGFPFRSDEYVSDPEAPRLLRGANIAQGNLRWDAAKRWPQEASEHLAPYWLRKGDVVIAMDRPWIEAGLKSSSVRETDLPALLVQRVARLRGSDRLDTRFLSYVIGCHDFAQHILSVQTGTAVPHISAQQIKEFEFLLPHVHQQRAIAHILGTLDDKIELNRGMNETLEAMARALFKSWFVDFDPVRATMAGRDTGLPQDIADLFPDRLVDSEMGEIPEGWEAIPLDAIARFQNGLALQKYRPAPNEARLPAVKIAQLRAGEANSGEWASATIRPECIVENGDILFSWSGSLLVKTWCGGRAALNQHLFKVTSERYPKWFYLHSLLSHLSAFQRIAQDKATTMGHIRRHHLTEALCVAPPDGLIAGLSDTFSCLLERQVATELSSRTLAVLRDTLLPKLISGEIRLGKATKAMEAGA